MSRGVMDLRGMEREDIMTTIGENISDLKEGESIEFILNREEIVETLKQLNLKMESQKVGENYIVRISGGKIEKAEKEFSQDITIDEKTNVGQLVARYPESIEILAKYGFSPIKNPILRKTLAKTITLGQAKKLGHLSEEKFEALLAELRQLKKA
jgi:hypothetical protein